MRVTGKGNLDPDFSRIKRKEKILFEIRAHSLYESYPRTWLLDRINPTCENCSQGDSFRIVMKFVPISFLKLSKRYFISCKNCGEEIELEYWEYLKLRGI
jgi:hypothetical protein